MPQAEKRVRTFFEEEDDEATSPQQPSSLYNYSSSFDVALSERTLIGLPLCRGKQMSICVDTPIGKHGVAWQPVASEDIYHWIQSSQDSGTIKHLKN